ncbi:hypothetical protein Tco_0280800 [Tanacetum coccineum]
MPFLRFTRVIINHFLSQHKSLSNLNYQHYHTIKDDGIVSRLKFVRIREVYQDYILPNPDMMMNNVIKQSESYQMFIKYSTGQIPPTKSRGKGSQGKKTADVSEETIDVSEESEPEPAKKKTRSRSTRDVVIQDTLNIMQAIKDSKKISRRQPGTGGSNERTGVSPGVPDESIVVPATSSEGTDSDGDEEKDDTGNDKSIDLEMTDDEETNNEFVHGVEQLNDDEDEEMTNAEVEESGNDDEENTDAAKMDARKTEKVKDDAKKAKLPPTSSSLSVSLGFGDQFLKLLSNNSLVSTVKDTTDAEINSLLDIKIQSKAPYIQSPSVLRVPSSMISKPSVLTQVQETPSVSPITTLYPPFVSTIPPVPHQTTTPIPTPPITTESPTITTAVPESDALPAVQLRVSKLEKGVSGLKKYDISAKALATLKSQVPNVVDEYLGSKLSDALQKTLQKHSANLIKTHSIKPAPESSKIQTPTVNLKQGSEKSASEIIKIKREQDEKQKMSKYTIKSTDKAALKEYDQKSALYQTMYENKSFNRNPANHALYHALMEHLIKDGNAMDKGGADTVKDHKRKHDDDDDDPPARLNQGIKTKRRRTKELESSKKPSTTKETPKGKALSKGSKTGKSTSTKEPVEEPIPKVVMDDAVNTTGEDVQPLRPPTPDPEWNKHQVVLGQPEQPWFNQMVSTTKDPLTFNDLMATLIDFSKYVLNRLKIDNLTQDLLLGPAYNLLKGTCSSSIKLEYNFQECFNALTDKLDWNNPEGDRYPFDLSQHLPLQGHPGHLTIAVDYFFNNDLEYLKSSDSKRTYTTSITKTKAARYEIVGIKDMKILGVKSVSVKKLHGYGHLEEVVVTRADRQLYKFKEGDFVDLHLNENEDMLILVVKHKLFNLNNSDIVDFIVALRMFTRSLVIKRRVEDLQLDKKRSELMVELIDKQMLERRIIRNLKRLVGAREFEMDYKLMMRTI